MKWTTECWVALSLYRPKWLWWLSKVLVEAQGNRTHLLFPPLPCSSNAARLLSFINSHRPSRSPSPQVISIYHKFPFLPHSFLPHFISLPPFCHPRHAFFPPVEPRFIFSSSFSWSVLASSRQSESSPLLHLPRSYLLVVLSVSIRADCCHFCPCVSFLILFFSFLDAVRSAFLHLPLYWWTMTKGPGVNTGEVCGPLEHFISHVSKFSFRSWSWTHSFKIARWLI